MVPVALTGSDVTGLLVYRSFLDGMVSTVSSMESLVEITGLYGNGRYGTLWRDSF
ncbi:MAG: hypothetical protein HGB22_08170 [Chlorobiaceae bacterium]|nr:hypothetical protein [Chlorobiaceae bacterium]